MLTDGQELSISPGATINLFLGRPIEFIGVPSVARILLVADAAGLTAQMLINIGGDQRVPLAAGTSVPVASVVGAGPKDDEDTVIPQAPLPAGARVQLNVTNPGAAAVKVRYRALIQP